jgi:hypothetical protein
MGVIVRSADVAAGAVNANVWAGSVFEYARSNGLLSLGIIMPETAAAGPAAGLLATINVGADVVAEEFPLPTVDPAIVGRNAPIIPDDFWFQDAAAQGDRIVTSIRNPTGGALAFYGVAIFTPTR